MQGIWVGIKLNCNDTCVVPTIIIDTKLHIFATNNKANTYYEHLIHSLMTMSQCRVEIYVVV